MRSLIPFAALALLALSSAAVFTQASDDDASDAAAAAPAAAALEVTPFSFYDYIAGEWEVFRHTASFKDGSVHYDASLPSFRWRLEKENHTSNLVGFGWTNGSSPSDASLSLRVELHDTASGKFQAGADADDLATLFDFSFSQARGSVPMSVGAWLGAEVGDASATYSFQASSPDRFTLTIIPRNFDVAASRRASAAAAASNAADRSRARKSSDADADEDDLLGSGAPATTGHDLLSVEELAAAGAEAIVIVGHRHKVEPEKTFFQRYGTMVMLAGMLILNVWMRTRQSTQMATQQARLANAAPATARAATAAAAAGSSKSKAKVEEIPDTDAGSKKAH